MTKLCPGRKVYQGVWGYDPLNKMPLALGKVTVNNKNEMSNF